ncbi:Ataxin-2 like protein [Astathelohania contejeani]|uniref:Ataxin-2 like protein n=1 Tax=Astathelohania contejeani TaxID=164912 RepID=A0ABQ7HY73_9MICR|nr:Ataxin-2 like protein [Thelohania contejeani]
MKNTQNNLPKIKIIAKNGAVLNGQIKSYTSDAIELCNAYFNFDDDIVYDITINTKDISDIIIIEKRFLTEDEILDCIPGRKKVVEEEKKPIDIAEMCKDKKVDKKILDDMMNVKPGKWNQFEANMRLFGVIPEFDESLYTTPLDRNSEFYKNNIEDAKRIAKEILESKSDDKHVMEERGKYYDDNEEDKYSAVNVGKKRNRNNRKRNGNTSKNKEVSNGVITQKERLEKDKKLEKERLEKERLEKEKLEKERSEKERLEKEKLEKERLEKERLEKEKLEKEKLEKERENKYNGKQGEIIRTNENKAAFNIGISGNHSDAKKMEIRSANIIKGVSYGSPTPPRFKNIKDFMKHLYSCFETNKTESTGWGRTNGIHYKECKQI